MRPAPGVDRRPPPRRAASSRISIRFEADVLHRLRRLAAARGIGYQTLLKRYIVERLYEEEHANAQDSVLER